MPNRKTLSCISPAGVRHFYRSADLHGLRLALWEDGAAGAGSVADYLRQAGASVEVLVEDAPRTHTQTCAPTHASAHASAHPPTHASVHAPVLPPMLARHRLAAPWDGDGAGDGDGARDGAGPAEIRFSGSLVAALVRPGPMQVDAAVLNLRNPAPLAQSLQAAGIPFVIFAQAPGPGLGLYPHGHCVPSHEGPEALASAILLHSAIYRAGLCCTPEMTVTDMLPRLRALARYLVQDAALADALVEDALEQALALLPHLGRERELGALLVTLVERIWQRQKMSRPT
ncbi:hypothetical protein E3U26_17205 (plasmid) [Paracoccus ferrooxidans]|nr:hypothetical protein E3U26_17205 [Paracoccus ferrooxidans]